MFDLPPPRHISTLRRVGLDMMAAILTPHDEPHMGPCSAAERRRRARPRSHRTASAIDRSTAAPH
jgi:hypothetical protein